MTAERPTLADVRDEAAALAASASPAEMLLAAFLGVFSLLGWVIGRAWFLGAFCAVAFRVGYWNGAKIPPEQRRRKQPEPPRQQ